MTESAGKKRLKILFFSQRFPYPMDTGGKIRTGKLLEQYRITSFIFGTAPRIVFSLASDREGWPNVDFRVIGVRNASGGDRYLGSSRGDRYWVGWDTN